MQTEANPQGRCSQRRWGKRRHRTGGDLLSRPEDGELAQGFALTAQGAPVPLIACAAYTSKGLLGPCGRHPAPFDPLPLVALLRLGKRDALGRLR